LGDNTWCFGGFKYGYCLLQSNYAEAYDNRGLVKEKSATKKKRFADYQLAITYQPNYGEAYYNLALATYDDQKS
jgi:hypothetical protein